MNPFTVPGAKAIMAGTSNLDVSPLQSVLQNDAQEEYDYSLGGVRELSDLYQKAADRIRAQRVGPSGGEYWYNLAAALGKPTKTGSRGETMANVAQALGQYRAAQREAEAQKQSQLDQLEFTKQAEILKRKYAMQEAIAQARLRQQPSRPLVLQPGSVAIDPVTKQVVAKGLDKPEYVIRRFADGSYGYVPVAPGTAGGPQMDQEEEAPDTLPADFFGKE